MSDTVVIVGASLAGATAAHTLRTEGFEGTVVLVGAEAHLPYERPPLSKDYLQGKAERSDAFVHAQDWYTDNDVDLRLATTVTTLDLAGGQVVTGAGDRIRFDTLLLCTGSTPRTLPVPGADLAGVHYLRTVEDSDRIRAAFGESGDVVVIGAGWIGLEAAAAAREAGRRVTVLESAELPLLRVLGSEMAQVFADLHREHDVDLRFGVTVSEIVGDGAVSAVRLSDGTDVPAGVVVVGIGIDPVTGLAADAGLQVDNGVVTDEHLRTSDRRVYAAGDVASALHPAIGKHIRVEHWANAQRQGELAAKSILGQDVSDDRPPYFFTDQYDLGMEYTGYVEPGGYDDVVVRGDTA
ncbi:MAG: NAD(P)/FAD-dependent oxidoreductase, partial [Geodermatophilaceae bacterium]